MFFAMMNSRRGFILPYVRSFGTCSGSSPSTEKWSWNMKPVRRDPAKPHQPLTGYFRFLKDMLKETPHVYSGAKNSTKVAKLWRNLPDHERKKYLDIARVERAEYSIKKKEYMASGQKAAWARPVGIPLGVRTPYIWFLKQHRKQNQLPGQKYDTLEYSKIVGEDWKKLDPSKKKKYDDLFAQDKERYNREIEAFKASGAIEEWKERVGINQARRDKQEKVDREKAKQWQKRERRERILSKLRAQARKRKRLEVEKENRAKARVIASARRERDRAMDKVKSKEREIKRMKEQMLEKQEKFQAQQQTRRMALASMSMQLSKLRGQALAKINALPQPSDATDAAQKS